MEVLNHDMKNFWQFNDICHKCGIVGADEKCEILLRVLKTRSALAGEKDADAALVYKTMQTETQSLPRFKGDEELFYQFYTSLKDIDAHGILAFSEVFSDNRWQISAPDVLVHKFEEYINESVETVFVPECEEYGMALLDVIEAHPNIRFTLSTRYTQWQELLGFVYSGLQNSEIVFADIYTDGFLNSRFDLIFALPVFGARSLSDGQDFICKDSDMIAVQNLLYHVNMDGQLVIVLPAKITFGGGSIAALRDYIATNYSIKEISALPSGLFAPYTFIRTFLFVFGTGTTDEVIIRKYETIKPIRREDKCTELMLSADEMLFPDEFAELNGWNIDMVFSGQDEDLRAYADSSVKKAFVKEVATVFRGKAVNEKTNGGSIAVINISNLTETGIDYGGLEMLDEEERKVARYALEEGDVLVTSRGTTIKTAVFHKQNSTCIPSANINVIRPSTRIRGEYLKLFLESPVGDKMLKSLQRGTTVMNINYKDLGDLEIPLLSLEEQDNLISEYNEALSLYRKTLEAAEEAWNGVKKNIQSRLY